MADILQDLPIQASPARVFAAVSEPSLLDQWWTLRSRGQPELGSIYELDFGPGYLWHAVVTRFEPGTAFELRLTQADADWTGTRVGFELSPATSGTHVRFYHRDWPQSNDHHRASSHCWALYLRVLRRHLESGETVAYDRRLE
jgi:uncharacterized protein YndB with AHSA1/START domain